MKAIVTGASSGIGKDIAIYLDSLGYEVVLVSRDSNSLKKVSNLLKNESTVVALDLGIKDNCYKLYDMFKDEKIDILVNGAGFGLFGNTWETDLDRELQMIDLNITAVHILTKLFLKDMVKRDSGYIMNIASCSGFMSGPYLNTYYATKNYVTKWTMAIYEELRHINSHVKICALCPGPVDTNFNKVAGGEFTVKALSSSYVSKYAVDKMFKNKLVIIPGFSIRLGLFFYKFVPTKLALSALYSIQHKKAQKGK